MPDIDIPVPVDLKELFEQPDCAEIKIPCPEPQKLQLPTGGSLGPVADWTKGVPDDCSLSLNLMVQLAPLLSMMDCMVKMLKLLKPLIDVVDGLPTPPVKAIQEFGKAAADLAPCLLIPTPAAMVPFVRDILCLILKLLKCLIGNLKSIAGLMQGLSLQIDQARSAGNDELADALQCAQENAAASACNVMQSIEPVGLILELLSPLMEIAGVEPIEIPALGDPDSAEALNEVTESLQGVVGTVQIAVDTVGGCPE